MEGEVPNAAAVIVLDQQKVPRRVIVYSSAFMEQVQNATQNNWAGISILAHEIGHHLAGHTLLPGGSQPPIELEADKFSGYVLYKMGASLQEAQVAMNTFGSETEGETHPAKSHRLAAIEEGWKQACKQINGNCTSGTALATAPTPSPNEIPSSTPSLPSPVQTAIPLKFDRFVYDEANVLSDEVEKEFAQKLRGLAEKTGAEVVVLAPKSLNGLSIQEYALKMMKHMSIGKQDLANGGVVVIAPNDNHFGIVLMPGLYWKVGSQSLQIAIDGMEFYLKNSQFFDKNTVFNAVESAITSLDTDLGIYKWTMDYPTLAAAQMDAANSQFKITRLIGTLTHNTGSPNKKADLYLGEEVQEMELKTDDGQICTLNLLKALKPNLPTGQRYATVVRIRNMDFMTFEVLSLEPVN
jgi:uncharacterized membrane protein